MPVKPRIRILENGGWKHDNNNRFGAVVVGIFETYNKDGEVKVFHFAPTLEDLPIIRQLCNMVEDIDEHNKAVYNIKKKAEALDNVVRGGNCEMWWL